MKKTAFLIWLLAGCLCLAGQAWASADQPEIICPSEVAVGGAEPKTGVTTPALSLGIKLDLAETVALEPLDLERLRREDEATRRQGKGPLRIGVHRQLPEITAQDWRLVSDGPEGRILRLVIQAPEAVLIRPHFSRFPSSTKTRVFVYGQDPATAEGPISKPAVVTTADFWGPPLPGEYYFIEVVSGPGQVPELPVVDKISHVYRDVFFNQDQDKVGDCHNDITCASAAYRSYGSGVAGLATESYSTSFCTGSLVNDFDATSQTPWFLTANHCGVSASRAPSTYFYFRYQTATCNGPAPSMRSTTRRDGASHVFSTAASDSTLLRLAQAPPAGSRFNGWRTGTVGAGLNTSCIHHPDGSFKRISYGRTIGWRYNYYYDEANHITNQWTSGTTEPGSSGAPLFYGQQIIGQLHGGPGSCTAGSHNYDYYGRFSVSYVAGLNQYIGPNAGRPVTTPTGCTTSINFGQTLNWNLSSGCTSRSRSGGYYARYFRLHVSSPTRVTIDLTASWDTYLYLLDYRGLVVASDDDGGVGLNSRISRTLTAGDYLIEATSYRRGQTGSFSLAVSGGSSIPVPAGCLSSISPGQSVTGVLSGACVSLHRSNSYARYYTLRLTRTTRVLIDQIASWDTYLFLLNSGGQVVTSNDDGGIGLNSRIDRSLEPGTYTIEASSYGSRQSGSFTLRVVATSFSQ